jgi:hemerythrin
MPKYEWDKTLAVGVDLIDQQHRELIKKLDEVNSAVEKRMGGAKIVKTLSFLFDYTDYHFKTEEKNMKRCGYPDLEAHQGAHAELVDTLKDLEREFEMEGAHHKLAAALNTFLNNWLIKHIKGVDVKFGSYLREKGFQCIE